MLTEQWVRVSDDPEVDLFVVQTQGPADRTLLVVHGGPDWDHSYLRDPLVQLAGSHRVRWVDLRGCGRSTKGLADDQYTPSAAVEDLIALSDGAPVDVLGHSYGGLIAQRFALTAPRLVRKLIVSASSVYPLPANAFAGWAVRDRLVAAQPDVWSDPSLHGVELTRADALASAPMSVWRAESMPDYLDRIANVRFSAEWMRPWLAGTLPSPRLPDAAQRLAESGLPILLLHGRQDTTFPVELTTAATAAIATAEAVILDQAGTWPTSTNRQPGWPPSATSSTADRGRAAGRAQYRHHIVVRERR